MKNGTTVAPLAKVIGAAPAMLRDTSAAPVVLRWLEGEPPRTYRQHDYGPVIAQLATRPGSWACIRSGLEHSEASHIAYRLKRSGCEAVVRMEGGLRSVYARVVDSTPPVACRCGK